MRIPCPYCGERGSEEFAYRGSADAVRPERGDGVEDAQAWTGYVYLRDNPMGPHRELWHHASGCRAWLVVTRDTRTHEVISAQAERDAGPMRRQAAGSA